MTGWKKCRVAGRCGLGVALTLGVLMLVGAVRPGTLCAGRYAIGMSSYTMEVAVGSDTLGKQGPGWTFGRPRHSAVIVLGPLSSWRPTRSSAWMSVAAGFGGAMYTVNVYYVPLWPWAALLAVGGGVLLWWARRLKRPGHCGRCGYELRGLAGAEEKRCPECGEIGTLIQRVVVLLGRIGRRCFGPEHAAGVGAG